MLNPKKIEQLVIYELNCNLESIRKVKLLLSELEESTLNENDCLYFYIFQNRINPTNFYILSGWGNETFIERYHNQPYLRALTKKIRSLLFDNPKLVFNNHIEN